MSQIAVPDITQAGGTRPKQKTWKVYLHKPVVIIFLTLLAIMVVVSFVGPSFVGSPFSTAHTPLQAPGGQTPLGTDHLGRDYLARVVYGGRTSLLVGFSVALLCMTAGVLVGGLAGFYGGIVDTLLVKVAEFFQVIPGLLLALVAAALLGSNVSIIIGILAVTMWPIVARIARAEAMRIAELGYVESARAAGFSRFRIFWSDVIPNAMPPVLVATTMTVGLAILLESGLAFLGIGDANRPSWGALLNLAQPYITSAWWLAVIPGLCIFIVVLAVNMLGDALNDVLNPNIGKVK
ncbi:ABC transporter permease [Nesterenkonia flava]|uniref:ABC transporter permease n=1 Tax=Nesterenkonia flava TaxID=469799 RepID=A0ABU1FPL0_9MICC|nr:ABC transporter permease [Nesterenkonia flava]MDR5710570.1 ABC transporter permease [Nesterenkonia flava]